MTSESIATKAAASCGGIQCLSRLTRTLDLTLRAAVHHRMGVAAVCQWVRGGTST